MAEGLTLWDLANFCEDEDIKKVINYGLGGGVGDHLHNAAKELMDAVNYADARMLGMIADGLGTSSKTLKDFATWVWNDVPHPWAAWMYVFLLLGFSPRRIRRAFPFPLPAHKIYQWNAQKK